MEESTLQNETHHFVKIHSQSCAYFSFVWGASWAGGMSVNRGLVEYILVHSYCKLLCICFKEGLGIRGWFAAQAFGPELGSLSSI